MRFPYGAFQSESNTPLTGSMTNVSTTPIAVGSTTGYTATGALLIGTEFIKYTSITSTTFVGITRGAYGSTKSAHAIGDAVSAVQGTAAATPTPVYLNTTDYSNEVTLSATISSQLIFNIPGIYNIQFSLQAANATTTTDNITLWLRRNGANITGSAGVITVPSAHAGIAGNTLSGWNYVTQMNAADTAEIYWTTDNGDSVLVSYPISASPSRPSSPAILLTATFVSALP